MARRKKRKQRRLPPRDSKGRFRKRRKKRKTRSNRLSSDWIALEENRRRC